jgi:hypothetical protein
MGSYYVVLEVLISGRASEEVADIIIATIGDTYYNQIADSDDALTRFEAAVRATNHELGEHVGRGNAAWIGKLSAVIAIHSGSELHVASTGSAEAFLYRGHASTQITAGGSTKAAAPSKTFGSIATGQLEPGDRVLLSTPALVHQVPLAKLQSVIGQSSPNAAIAELTDLLQKPSETERIAALIIEVTTPELAALQVRSDAPSDVQLGTPENAFEAAKIAAAPLAHSTMAGSKKLAGVAQNTLQRARPHARAAGIAAAGHVRNLLSTRGGRRVALAGLMLVVAALGSIVWYGGSTGHASATVSAYQATYNSFSQAQNELSAGQKSAAQTGFTSVQQRLAGFKRDETLIDRELSKMNLPEGEPRTYAALASLVADRLDGLAGIVRATPTTVAGFAKGSKPEHFEVSEGKAYVFDAAGRISIVDLENGSASSSDAPASKLGQVVATSLAPDGQAIYILTAKPSVWLYRISTDTLSEQSSSGGWPAAVGLASYTTNLYLLTSDSVYKFTRLGASSFSAKSLYMGLQGGAEGSTAVTVDGSVYLAAPSELQRYLLGVLKESTPTPSQLTGLSGLRTDGGQALTAVSSKSKRIDIWTNGQAGLKFDKQVAVAGATTLADSLIDQHSGILYALVDTRLVRFAVQP